MVSAPYAARSSPSRQSMSASEERSHLPECSHADGRHKETRPYAASSLSTGGMSCDAVTSSRATQLASTHGRWTVESQLACRVRRVGQRRMRDHEAPASLRPDAARSQPRGSRLMSLSKVTEIGLIICTVYSVVCPCAQPQGARPLRHRGRTGYCARCGRVTFIFRRKIRLLAVVTI